MKIFSFGDIILLKFPFTKGKKYKKRPALVIRDTEDGDIIVCKITSKLYSSEFDIRINDWSNSGLKVPSIIRLHKFATLDKDLLDKKIGELTISDCNQVKINFQNLINS